MVLGPMARPVDVRELSVQDWVVKSVAYGENQPRNDSENAADQSARSESESDGAKPPVEVINPTCAEHVGAVRSPTNEEKEVCEEPERAVHSQQVDQEGPSTPTDVQTREPVDRAENNGLFDTDWEGGKANDREKVKLRGQNSDSPRPRKGDGENDSSADEPPPLEHSESSANSGNPRATNELGDGEQTRRAHFPHQSPPEVATGQKKPVQKTQPALRRRRN